MLSVIYYSILEPKKVRRYFWAIPFRKGKRPFFYWSLKFEVVFGRVVL